MTTITIERAVLLRALEALRPATAPNGAKRDAAFEELRAALSAPATAPEPVAYRYRSGRNGLIEWVTTTIHANAQAAGDYEPLFTHPAHTEAEVQELLSYFRAYQCLSAEEMVRRILGVPAP